MNNPHIIKNPAGTFSFVGYVPAVLGNEILASKFDVMGQRAYRDAAGKTVARRFPSFETRDAAETYANERGVDIAN